MLPGREGSSVRLPLAVVVVLVLSLVSSSVPFGIASRSAEAAAPNVCSTAVERYALAPDSRTVRAQAVGPVSSAGGTIERAETLLGAGGSAVIERQAGDDPSFILDFGQVVSGIVHLSATSQNGAELRMAMSESLQFLGRDSDVRFGDQRTYAWGLSSASAEYRTGQVTFRYLLIFLGNDARAELSDLYLEFTPFLGSPETYAGCFESSDDELNQIWYAGAYTLELSTAEDSTGKPVIYDGAKRDRDIWIGDLALEGRIEYLTHNQPDGVRLSLKRMADRQHENGLIPPSTWDNYSLIMFDYAAWWVVTFGEYYGHTGDLTFIKRYYPHLQRQMQWFDHRIGPNGLLVKDAGIEWAFTLGRSGEVTYLNAVYYRALREAALLADLLHKPDDAQGWRKQADIVKQAINARLFDASRGVFIDSDQDRTHVPQDGNVLAIAFDIAPRERWNGILDYLKRTMWTEFGATNVDVQYGHNLFHDKRIWPFIGYFELEARFAAGNDTDAYDLLRRQWGHMLASDPGGTMWEWMTADGRPENGFASLAHGWSAGATATLTERALGIRYTDPLFTSFDAIPHPGDLDWARGGVPTPHGDIVMSWQRTADTFDMSLVAPAETTARVGVPTFEQQTAVFVNGELAWDGSRSLAHGARLEGHAVLFDLPEGAHHIVATTDFARFPETGYTLSGQFKAFWDRSGGLPVFGFPLTAERGEDGNTAQYFERQRFELHPENAGTPYEVLLGLLGTAEAERRDLLVTEPFAPLISDAVPPDCVFVAETAHSLCAGFRTYWESHGLEFGDEGTSYREALALFGYPISEEFVDPDTGLMTQYFQRARFEFHPTNPPEWQVLLGRVGATLLESEPDEPEVPASTGHLRRDRVALRWS
jgi:hypothetical protein